MSADSTRDFLAELLPDGAFVTEPFDWSITGPAIDVSVGVSEQRLLDLAIPIEAFRKNTDCWQVIASGRAGTGNVKLATAMGPDEEAALIRLMGQLDILKRLAGGPWSLPSPKEAGSEP